MRNPSLFSIIAILAILLLPLIGTPLGAVLAGYVFLDSNDNLNKDTDEPGIPGVSVSNGRDVVRTDQEGRYALNIDRETVIFITKPSGYALPLNSKNLPLFYYIHRPQGSPRFEYEGVDPTGPLPDSLDFPLKKYSEPGEFDVLVFADPQPYTLEELDYIREDVIQELVGAKAGFGLVLGDIAANDLSLYEDYKDLISRIGIPFYHVPGNHDLNFDSPDDGHSLETFISHFGPPYFSFDYGSAHFVALDNVDFQGKRGQERGRYQCLLGTAQLEWLKNDLKYVSRDQLVVLATHIPLKTSRNEEQSFLMKDLPELLRILEHREKLLFLAGHTHTLEHHFIGPKEGWNGSSPVHQIICGTVCGSWWSGPKDVRGVPVADMADGAPNGYHILHFNGNSFTEKFKPASLDHDFQMRIISPQSRIGKDMIPEERIIVNIFDGSARSLVECQVDDLPTTRMQKAMIKDSFIESLISEHKNDFKNWVTPKPSHHIWTSPLPPNLNPGIHTITIRSEDLFGQASQSSKIFRVE
jgi:hypothetical protein